MRRNGARVAAILFLFLSACTTTDTPSPRTPPLSALFASSFTLADDALMDAVAAGETPGAVLGVSVGDREVHLQSVGSRGVGDFGGAMPSNAVFDLASLTKVIATTTLVLQLIDEGALALDTTIASVLPAFAENGKGAITVRDLLRHRGGLVADNALDDYLHGDAEAKRRTLATKPIAPRDTRYLYSDVGFIVLGWVVEALTHEDLDTRARRTVFLPLAMQDTGFLPLAHGIDPSRLVPTESLDGRKTFLTGTVHDPRARALGGVLGHAGLFSTASDLLRFGAMLARGGKSPDGRRILSEKILATMADPGSTAGDERRGLGWDMRVSNGGFGHTGFTGTSFWFFPDRGAATVLLTSRLHPRGKGDVKELRRAVGDAVTSAFTGEPTTRPSTVRTGLDRVRAGVWPTALRGKRIGLITNHTGLTAEGVGAVNVFFTRKDLKLTALFSPEHGIEGKVDAEVGDTTDPKTGLVVHSLYGKTRRPTPAMLEDVDVLVFDIQDIGTRFYTYVSTMVWAIEEAAKAKKAFVVLDRPNVIGGAIVEGPVTDPAKLDFVAALEIPVRHGMTVGELARFAVAEKGLDLDLTVIRMSGWRRGMTFDETGLPWVNPSPNMRSVAAAILYPGIGLLETTNLSVGRGTATPFEVIGAPWLDAVALRAALDGTPHSGVTYAVTEFTPDASVAKGVNCRGLRFTITDREAFRPVTFGLEIARALARLHPKEWSVDRFGSLLKHAPVRTAVLGDASPGNWATAAEPAFSRFLAHRAGVLVYE